MTSCLRWHPRNKARRERIISEVLQVSGILVHAAIHCSVPAAVDAFRTAREALNEGDGG